MANPTAPGSPGVLDRPVRVVLRSFRYSLEILATDLGAPGGAPVDHVTVRTDGAVAADRHHSATALDLGFGPIVIERVTIGGQHWTRDGVGPWLEERPGTPPLPDTLGIDPAVLAASDATARLGRVLEPLPSFGELVDGVETLRYELTMEQAQSLLRTGATVEPTLTGGSTLWVTRAELLPMRVLVEGVDAQGVSVRAQLDVTDHNANDISIVPPV
jgi:hypothetical protein